MAFRDDGSPSRLLPIGQLSRVVGWNDSLKVLDCRRGPKAARAKGAAGIAKLIRKRTAAEVREREQGEAEKVADHRAREAAGLRECRARKKG